MAAAAQAAKPGKPLSPLKAANALLAAGKLHEAIAAYEKMGVLKSKKAETWRLNNEALCYLKANPPAPEKAIPLLEGSVAADPDNYVAWNSLGSAYARMNDFKKAKEAFRKSIDAGKAAGVGTAGAETNLQGVLLKLDQVTVSATPTFMATGAAPPAGGTPAVSFK
jgi:tetratricopeptide (TPR) repeat protein